MLGIDAQAARRTWTAAVILVLLGTVYLIREALLVFVIALLLAYLLYPLVDLIERRLSARTRTPALALTWLLVIGLVAVFGTFAGSVVAAQAANLAREAPALLTRFQNGTTPANPLLAALEEQLRAHSSELAAKIPGLVLQVLSASGNLIYLIIIPILSFFILRDGRVIRDSFLDMLDSGRESAKDTLTDIHTLLLQYMRALFLLCLATFVSLSVVLSAMRVPYAILLASIAFPLEFIPMVGPLAAAVIILGVSAASGFPHVLWVAAYLGLYRMFQDYVLSPHLMSKGVELHPLLVIFGVFAGGEIGGVAGIFLSIPALAMARVLYQHMRNRRIAA